MTDFYDESHPETGSGNISKASPEWKEMLETARNLLENLPDEAENVVVKPYQPGSHKCCCDDPDCAEFEDRMAAQGVPLDEIVTVTYEMRLGDDRLL